MQVLVVEIRDRATLIPAVAMRQSYPLDRRSVKLLSHAGFGKDLETQQEYVFLMRLSDQEAHYDPFSWENRTMRVAHQHLTGEWDQIENGYVIDVQFLEGETERPVKSEVNFA